MEVGHVGRPHGLEGAFIVTLPAPSALVRGGVLAIDGVEREIVRRAGTDAKPIVGLEGVTTRDAAVALRGRALLAQRAALPELEDDEWWADDLIGCTVTDGERELGVVDAFMPLPSCEALSVGGRLIPLVRDAVRSVDVAAKRIDVDLAFLGE